MSVMRVCMCVGACICMSADAGGCMQLRAVIWCNVCVMNCSRSTNHIIDDIVHL